MLIMVLFIVLALVNLGGLMVFEPLNDEVQNSTEMPENAKNITSNLYTIYPSLFDNLILFAFAMLSMGLLVAVYIIDVHPIFLFFNLILLACVFVIAILLSNAYDDMASDDQLSAFAMQFPFTTWLTTNLVPVMVALLFLVMLVMFAKTR